MAEVVRHERHRRRWRVDAPLAMSDACLSMVSLLFSVACTLLSRQRHATHFSSAPFVHTHTKINYSIVRGPARGR